MLFTPEAHEALVDEPWSAERSRAAIASIVADAESAFDDGWPTHPMDAEDENEARTRFRTVYLGGAGVVDALHRLERRGFVELHRDYVPYLERSLEAQPDFPDYDSERSLWMGELGIRLVLQRLAPSHGEPRAAVRADRRQRAGRALRADVGQSRHDPRRAGSSGLDVTREHRVATRQAWDPDGVWTQDLNGLTRRFSARRTASLDVCSRSAMSPTSRETLRRFADRGRRARQLAGDLRGKDSAKPATVGSARSGVMARRESSRRSATSRRRGAGGLRAAAS